MIGRSDPADHTPSGAMIGQRPPPHL